MMDAFLTTCWLATTVSLPKDFFFCRLAFLSKDLVLGDTSQYFRIVLKTPYLLVMRAVAVRTLLSCHQRSFVRKEGQSSLGNNLPATTLKKEKNHE